MSFQLLHKTELKRKMAALVAWSFHGTFYSWGGDDPSSFDCSGLCIEILKSVGLLPRKFDTTASGLYNRLGRFRVGNPSEGCLVFWQNKDGEVEHIEYCIDPYHSMGASGGGSNTITKTDAIRDNAFVKVRPIHRKRLLKGYIDPFLMLNDFKE